MIIKNDSFFKNPPKHLNPELVSVINAIRYSIEICEISYIRLVGQLDEISVKKNNYLKEYEFASVFLDAWSIINNAVIFRKILNEHFEIDKNDILFKELNKAVQLRDTYQHVDERITQISATKDIPIFGILTWLKTFIDSNKFVSCSLFSGSFTNKETGKIKISNSKDENHLNSIQNIELTAIVRQRVTKNKYEFIDSKILLSKIMYDIEDIITILDDGMKIHFSDLINTERHLSDLMIRMKGYFIN